MCGRYTLRRSDLAELGVRHPFELERFEEFSETRILPDRKPGRYDPFTPRYNIAPSQDVPVVRLDVKGERAVDLVRWGLIPSWTRGKPKTQPINARAETLATSGMFRQAFERRRCLIPADGFYEWRRIDAKTKQPMYIRRRDDGVFAFAGLWERWRPDADPDAEPLDTCTIITTAPNELIAPIHDRMPVILEPGDYARWLDRDVAGAGVAGLLRPYRADEMEAWPVSTVVNSPRNDEPACVAPLAES